jgi:hypothetical protein
MIEKYSPGDARYVITRIPDVLFFDQPPVRWLFENDKKIEKFLGDSF